jgi:alkanesulfonate monooxygenase SsuD/methylene tetrahydromethanopterin reductase-like flavin-dependent oxidoreductase (luciferase family)
MHLAYALSPFGHHPAAASHSDIGPAATTFEALARQVSQAEQAGFDLVVVDDASSGPGNDRLPDDAAVFEPTTLVAALVTKVEHIGFISSASTVDHAPYNLARRFASVDNSSGGRIGWNVVAKSADAARDVEYVGLVKALWDSWEDDAFIYDKKAARFFQPEKMHVLNHEGPNFSVRGPLNVNRSPQGRPIISAVLSAGAVDLAARFADVVFIRERSVAKANGIATEFSERLDQLGRSRSEVRIFLSVMAYLGNTTEDARHFHSRLDQQATGGVPAETVVGTATEVADRMSSLLDRLKFDGVEFLQPVVSEMDFLLFDFAAALRDRLGPADKTSAATLRQFLGLKRPDFPSTQPEEIR